MKMLRVRFLEVVVGAPGLAAQVTAECLLVTLGPVAVPGVCGTPGWRCCKMCISVESHDDSASSWLSHEGSCPRVLCKADAHLKKVSSLSLVYSAVSFTFLHGSFAK